MTTTLQRVAVVLLACAGLSGPAAAQAARMTPDEFRAQFNAVCRSHGLTMQLEKWKEGLLGSPALTALVTRNVRMIAQPDADQRLSSLLMVMWNTGSLESITEIVTSLAAATYAINPDLTTAEREALFTELGLYADGWGERGLDGVAVRSGVTYRAVHPAGDPLVVAIVSWKARRVSQASWSSLPQANGPRVAFAQGGAEELPPPLPDDERAGPMPPPPPPDDEPVAESGVPAEAVPPALEPDLAAFESRLAPYGRWVYTPEYGRVWIPSGVDPDWQPYARGRWVRTEWGWSFVSGVPWGWATFHYGRWGWQAGLGWFWVPGLVWAPAWVAWRVSAGYVCWAPFGPRGFHYGGGWHGWVAVPSQHFLHPLHRHLIPHRWAGPIVRGARPAPSARPPPRRPHPKPHPRGHR